MRLRMENLFANVASAPNVVPEFLWQTTEIDTPVVNVVILSLRRGKGARGVAWISWRPPVKPL